MALVVPAGQFRGVLKGQMIEIDEKRILEVLSQSIGNRLAHELPGPCEEFSIILSPVEILGPQIVQQLVERLCDKDRGIQKAAAYALERIGSAAEPALTELSKLVSSPTSELCLAALRAIGSIARQSENARSTLIGFFKDSDEGIRHATVCAAKCLHLELSVDVAKAYAELLVDSNPHIAQAAAEGLECLGRHSACVLSDMFGRADSVRRVAIMSVISEFGDLSCWVIEGLVPFLLECCRDGSSEVRAKAALIFRYLNDSRESVYVAILLLLKDGDPQVRISALRTFAAMPKDCVKDKEKFARDVEQYLSLLDDPESTVRRAAVQGLRQFRGFPCGMREVVKGYFVRRMQDSDSAVRLATVETTRYLEDMVGAMAPTLLIAFQSEENADIRGVIANVLWGLDPSNEIVDRLVCALKSSDTNVLGVAVHAANSSYAFRMPLANLLTEILQNSEMDISMRVKIATFAKDRFGYNPEVLLALNRVAGELSFREQMEYLVRRVGVESEVCHDMEFRSMLAHDSHEVRQLAGMVVSKRYWQFG